MSALLSILARTAVWFLQREAMRDKQHRQGNDSRDCMCEPCQWVRGVEADADAYFGGRKWQ